MIGLIVGMMRCIRKPKMSKLQIPNHSIKTLAPNRSYKMVKLIFKRWLNRKIDWLPKVDQSKMK